MTSLLPIANLSALLARPTPLVLATIAGAAALLWRGRGAPDYMGALPMDTINPERSAQSDLPTTHDASSIRELERLFRLFSQPENQVVVYRRFAESAGIDMNAQEMWLLNRLAEIVGATEDDLAQALRVAPDALAKPLASLQQACLVTTGDDSLCLTDDGRAIVQRMSDARSERLAELFSEWAPGGHYEIQQMIVRFTKTLNAHMPPED